MACCKYGYIRKLIFSIFLSLICNLTNVRGVNGDTTNETELDGRIGIFPSCLFSCGVANPPLSFELKIAGGIETGIHEFPWMGYLVKINDGSFVGGVTLITNQELLTAASLVHGLDASNYLVVLGDHDRTVLSDAPSFAVHVQEFIIHPNFKPENFVSANDIAIVSLKRKVAFTRSVRPICLPWPSLAFFPLNNRFQEQIISVAGWGSTDSGGLGLSNVLQTTDLPIITQHKCQQLFRKLNVTLPENVFCAMPDNDIAGTCTGDVGGPAAWDPQTPILQIHIYFAIGVILPNNGCGENPSVLTRVDKFLDFIRSNTNIAKC